uniref:DUF4939 domain-containing protein n=1 Tax=Nothobranchius furzeri TaxID=105023 RepID=A0A8C6NTB3_NOTFU
MLLAGTPGILPVTPKSIYGRRHTGSSLSHRFFEIHEQIDLRDRMTESVDPAEFERLKIRMKQMENEFIQLHALIDWLNTKQNSQTDLLLQLSTALHALQQQALTSATEGPHFSLPERWNGETGSPDGLLATLDMQFECQPGRFPSARSRVAHLTSLLYGRAAEWAAALYNSKSPACNDYAAFVSALRKTFVPPSSEVEAEAQLLKLRQRERDDDIRKQRNTWMCCRVYPAARKKLQRKKKLRGRSGLPIATAGPVLPALCIIYKKVEKYVIVRGKRQRPHLVLAETSSAGR